MRWIVVAVLCGIIVVASVGMFFRERSTVTLTLLTESPPRSSAPPPRAPVTDVKQRIDIVDVGNSAIDQEVQAVIHARARSPMGRPRWGPDFSGSNERLGEFEAKVSGWTVDHLRSLLLLALRRDTGNLKTANEIISISMAVHSLVRRLAGDEMGDKAVGDVFAATGYCERMVSWCESSRSVTDNQLVPYQNIFELGIVYQPELHGSLAIRLIQVMAQAPGYNFGVMQPRYLLSAIDAHRQSGPTEEECAALFAVLPAFGAAANPDQMDVFAGVGLRWWKIADPATRGILEPWYVTLPLIQDYDDKYPRPPGVGMLEGLVSTPATSKAALHWLLPLDGRYDAMISGLHRLKQEQRREVLASVLQLTLAASTEEALRTKFPKDLPPQVP